MYYVYILRSIDHGRYYIGQTENLGRRLMEHNSGKVYFTSKCLPWGIEIFLLKSSRKEALILERKLKNLNKEDLEEFILKYKLGNNHAGL